VYSALQGLGVPRARWPADDGNKTWLLKKYKFNSDKVREVGVYSGWQGSEYFKGDGQQRTETKLVKKGAKLTNEETGVYNAWQELRSFEGDGQQRMETKLGLKKIK
jgi:hypothetical protein